MKRIRLFFTALTLLLTSVVYAQNITVSGTVRDVSNDTPVPFASIQIKGTFTGGSTDIDGNYSIEVSPKATLVFSSIGYLTQEIDVDGKTKIDILLQPDTEQLEETIVVAFGTATKESFTGSATVVKSSDIAKVQSTDATRSLEGMVAGVQMTTSSGSLDSKPSIMIRGIGSISAGSSPLYIVDGVPYSGDMNNLNPNDIESMTVLKDAASNALYGSRGANGVIMITTKKAKAGEAKVNIDAKWGWNSKALKDYDYITEPGQYYEAHYAALYNYYTNKQELTPIEAYQKANITVAGPASAGGLGYLVYTLPEGQNLIGNNGKLNPNAILGRKTSFKGQDFYLRPDNWTDEAYRNSLRQEYNISVSGTTGKAAIFASFGYLNNKAIIEGADMYRYTARLRADYQAKSWLKIGGNAAYTNYNWDNGNSNEGSGGSAGNIFAFASKIAPIYPVYMRDGNGNIMIDERGMKMYDYGDGRNAGLSRPIQPNANALQSVTLDKHNDEGNSFNGTAYAEVTFLKDFKATFNVGSGIDETRSTYMNNMYYGQFAPDGGSLSKNHGRRFYLNMQQLLSWDKSFSDKHHASILLGHESYKMATVSLGASKSKLFSMDNMELNGAIIDGQKATSAKSTYNNEGYFLRAQYDFMNKLFFSASYRLDASSKFHPDHRWGSFWSVGGGWLINEEPWFRAPWIDMLKIKASVGSQGNDNIGSYLYVDTYSITNSNDEIAVTFVQKGNPDITWETNTNFNAGIDFDLFRGRLSGSVEYFYRLTSDMLFFFSTPISIGYSGYFDNIGDMRNSGIELSLNGAIIRNKNLNWNMYANFTHYTNKILMLPDEFKTTSKEGHAGYANGNKFIGEGLPLNTFLLKEYAGVERETGLPMWYRTNKKTGVKETTTEYSRATDYLSSDPTPLAYGGFGTSLDFYGFDVAVAFTYSIGGKTYDSGYAGYMSVPSSGGGSNYHKDVFKAWTPENKDTDIPRWQYKDENITAASTRFLIDASYLNFQNAQFGYTFPKRLTQKIHVEKLRFYVSCDNIFYWSKRQGLDPRHSFSGSTNSSMNSPIRTLSGGINITF